MAGIFQINPRTGKPYTVDEAMAVGMPQQGVMQQPESMMQQPMQQPMPQPTVPAGGMFGQAAKPKGGAWRDVLGSVFDVMSAAGGGQPVYWGTKMAEKQKADAWGQELEKINAMAAARAQYKEPTGIEQKIAAYKRYAPNATDDQIAQLIKSSFYNPFTMVGGEPYRTEDLMSGFSGGGGQAQTQVIDGVTYYNINGKWYDNPEGR